MLKGGTGDVESSLGAFTLAFDDAVRPERGKPNTEYLLPDRHIDAHA